MTLAAHKLSPQLITKPGELLGADKSPIASLGLMFFEKNNSGA